MFQISKTIDKYRGSGEGGGGHYSKSIQKGPRGAHRDRDA